MCEAQRLCVLFVAAIEAISWDFKIVLPSRTVGAIESSLSP